jgi:ssDNA-binding Zn-finger/Zn-ribbon topoisomerase 1
MGGRGYDVCVKCGYWLKVLGEAIKRCPECGMAREAVLKSKTG